MLRYRYSPPAPTNTVSASYPVTAPGSQHLHFSSPPAFAAWCREKGIGTDRSLRYYDSDHISAQQGIDLLVKGDETYVEEAKAFLSQVQEQIEAPTTKWEHSLQGAFPDVHRYLAGDPEDMWYRAPTTSDRTPLRIYIGLASSWNITPAQLRRRGIVLAAFAIAMADVRPVFITPYLNGHDYGRQHHGIISYDIDTSPLVLSQLLACVADARCTRYLHIPSVFFAQSRIDWAVAFNDIKRSHIPNIQPGDLYLPPITNYDPLLTDPLGWLRANLAHYSDADHDYDLSPETLLAPVTNNRRF